MGCSLAKDGANGMPSKGKAGDGRLGMTLDVQRSDPWPNSLVTLTLSLK